MATSTAVKNEQPGQIDLSALKTKQHGALSLSKPKKKETQR